MLLDKNGQVRARTPQRSDLVRSSYYGITGVVVLGTADVNGAVFAHVGHGVLRYMQKDGNFVRRQWVAETGEFVEDVLTMVSDYGDRIAA